MLCESGEAASSDQRIEAAGKSKRERVGARIGIARPIEDHPANRCRSIETLGNQFTKQSGERRAEFSAPLRLRVKSGADPILGAIRLQPWSPPSGAWRAP